MKGYEALIRRSKGDSITVPKKPIGNLAFEFKGKVNALIAEGSEENLPGSLLVRLDRLEKLVDGIGKICSATKKVEEAITKSMSIGVDDPVLLGEIDRLESAIADISVKIELGDGKRVGDLKIRLARLETELEDANARKMELNPIEKDDLRTIETASCGLDAPKARREMDEIKRKIDDARDRMEMFDAAKIRDAAKFVANFEKRVEIARRRKLKFDMNFERQKLRKNEKIVSDGVSLMGKVSAKLSSATKKAEELFDEIQGQVELFNTALSKMLELTGKIIAYNEKELRRERSG